MKDLILFYGDDKNWEFLKSNKKTFEIMTKSIVLGRVKDNLESLMLCFPYSVTNIGTMFLIDKKIDITKISDNELRLKDNLVKVDILLA